MAAAALVPMSALADDNQSKSAASSMDSAIAGHHDTATYSFHYATSQAAAASHGSHAALGIIAILIFLVIGVALIALHFLPGIIASRRHHRNALAIWLVNLFFGWTLIGWVVCLIWALN